MTKHKPAASRSTNRRTFLKTTGAATVAAAAIPLRVLADDGDIEIVGRPDISTVRVYATACANDRSTLDDIEFDLFRNGATIELETLVQARDNARLDLVIEVPEELAVALYSEEGDIDVRDVDFVYIDDESGHISVRNVFYDVEIVDESGNIVLIRLAPARR